MQKELVFAFFRANTKHKHFFVYYYMQEEVMARHGLLMLLEVLLLGLVLFWCAPAQQKAAGHKQRVPEGLSLSSSVVDPDLFVSYFSVYKFLFLPRCHNRRTHFSFLY
jgi:hypothetical protein